MDFLQVCPSRVALALFIILKACTIISAFSSLRSALQRGGLAGPPQRQNSRTRFLARIHSLGPGKLDLLRSGKLMGIETGLPPGFSLVDGQVMDVSYKVVQRRSAGGTAYYSYEDQVGQRPLYVRPGSEFGWSFVVFQDPFYWRGSGHLILLKRVHGVNINFFQGQPQLLYDAYVMSLRMSFRPSVEMLDFQFRATVERKKRKFGELRRLRTMYKQRGKFYLHNRMMRRGGRRQRSVNIDLEDENANYYMSDRHENCFLSRLNATKQFLMKLKEN